MGLEYDLIREALDPYRRGPRLRFAAMVHLLSSKLSSRYIEQPIESLIEDAEKFSDYIAGDESELEILVVPEAETVQQDNTEDGDPFDRGPYL